MTGADPNYFDWLYQQQRRSDLAEQKPSVGRIVLVSGESSNGVTEHPAVVNRVWSDVCVNVMVLPDCGAPYSKTSVMFSEDGTEKPNQWRWPPRV